jgi:NDP-hexose-3-ketoreductase
MDFKKYKVGVLGCANVAERRVIPSIQAISRLELVAVASRSTQKADNFAMKFNCKAVYSYDDLLTDSSIDIVYIPLPTGLHYEWAIKAMKAGKHILVEKSLGANLEEVEEMLAVSKENKVCIWEDFMFMFHSQHQFVKQQIADGKLGEIRSMRASFGFPPFPSNDNIRYSKKLGGGALLDAGAYTLRVTQFLFEGKWEVKSAFLKVTDNYEVDIYGGVFLVNETLGVFSEVAFGFDNFYQCNYEIWGSKGKLIAHRAYTPDANLKPLITIELQGEKEQIELPEDNHFVNILNAFCEAVDNNNYALNHKSLREQARLIQDTFKISNYE